MLDKKLQILRAIIVFLAVDVMNDLFAPERTSQFICHYKAMFKNVAILVGHTEERMVGWNLNQDIAMKVLFLASLPTARGRAEVGASPAKACKVFLGGNMHRHLSCGAITVFPPTPNSHYPPICWVSRVVLLVIPINDASIRKYLLTRLLNRSSSRGAALATNAVKSNVNTACANRALLAADSATNGNVMPSILLKALRPENRTSIGQLLVLSYSPASSHGPILPDGALE